MSIISDLKKLWDVLHPSISTKRAVITGLVVFGVALSWAIIPAVVIGCFVYGASSLKEFFYPSTQGFANNIAVVAPGAIQIASASQVSHNTRQKTEFAMRRSNDMNRIFSSSSQSVGETTPEIKRSRSLCFGKV